MTKREKSMAIAEAEIEKCRKILVASCAETTAVAWRRIDTAYSVITENERIVRGWDADGLPYEPLYTGDQIAKMQR